MSDSSRFWRHAWLPVVVVGGVVGAGLWWWQERALQVATGQEPTHWEPDSASVSLGAALDDAAPSGAARPAVVQASAAAPARPAPDRPDDFTDADWAALKMAVSRLPNGEQELIRAASFLRFQRLFDRWQALENKPESPERRAVASTLLEQIPERLGRGEISMEEAQMVGNLLLYSATSNDALRLKLSDAFRQELEAKVPQDSDERRQAEAQLLMEYKRRQAALVQEWQARPAESRDPTRLQRQLEEARRALYSARP